MPDLALTKPDRGGRPLHRPSQKSRSKVDLLLMWWTAPAPGTEVP